MKHCYNSIVLVVICSVISFAVAAQEVKYTKYDDFDFRTGEFSVVGKVGERLYVYRGSAEGYYLDAYDDNMERMATVILDFLPKRVYKPKFITYNDKIIVLHQETEGSTVTLFASILDTKGRIIKGPVRIDDIRSSLLGGRSGLYNYAIADDKQTLCIYGAGQKGNDLQLRVIWLDTTLSIAGLSNTSFTAEDDPNFGEGLINNSGSFYLPVYTITGARQYADRVWLLSMAKGSAELNNTALPLNGLYAAGTYMKLDKSGDRIYVGGFYSDKRSGHCEGVLYAYYDANTNDFPSFKTIPFSANLRAATGERNKKRAFDDYKVHHLIVKNDGGFVLIAEDSYITTRNNYSQGFGYYSWYYPTMSASVREFNYGDIFLASYNGYGEMDWSYFVRKYQYSQEDGGLFSSYALVNTGGSLGLLFNDFNMSRSRMQLASVDAEGEVNLRALTGFSLEDPDWLPRSGKQVSGSEFVAPCLKRNRICFAKIVF